MAIWSRVFGAQPRVPASQSTNFVRLTGPGLFSLQAVGESNYQSALDQICGGRSYDAANMLTEAMLVYEDANPYDDQAIRIDIDGRTVGYLSKAHARKYRREMEKAGHAGRVALCAARIRGGWDRGSDDHGSYGVRLDVAILRS